MANKIQDITPDKIRKPEKVKLNKRCRVKEHNSDTAKGFDAGDVVTVSGMNKLELLFRPIDENTKLGTLVAPKAEPKNKK